MCYGTKLAALSRNLGGTVPQSPRIQKVGRGRVPPSPQWLRPCVFLQYCYANVLVYHRIFISSPLPYDYLHSPALHLFLLNN